MWTKEIISLSLVTLVAMAVASISGCSRKAEAPAAAEVKATPAAAPVEKAPAAPRPGYKTFSKYGLSFQHSEDATVNELGVTGKEASDDAGIVQVFPQEGKPRMMQLLWVKTPTYDLGATIESVLGGMKKAEGVTKVEPGERLETKTAGHRVVYEYFTVTPAAGGEGSGVVGVFYCDKLKRGLTLHTTNATQTPKDDALKEFQEYLDSLVCHGA